MMLMFQWLCTADFCCCFFLYKKCKFFFLLKIKSIVFSASYFERGKKDEIKLYK